MDLMQRLSCEAMEIEAPSQLDEELRSFSKPNLTTAPDDPSTPNTKEDRLDDENSHSWRGGGKMPPGRRREHVRKAPTGKAPEEVPTGTKRRRRNSGPNCAHFSWAASVPQSLSVSALFVTRKEGLCIAQKRLAASTSIATCIPLWPTYTLDIKGPVGRLELNAERWLHFEKRRNGFRLSSGSMVQKPTSLLTSRKNSSQMPSGPRGANFPLATLTVRATSRATRISP